MTLTVRAWTCKSAEKSVAMAVIKSRLRQQRALQNVWLRLALASDGLKTHVIFSIYEMDQEFKLIYTRGGWSAKRSTSEESGGGRASAKSGQHSVDQWEP